LYCVYVHSLLKIEKRETEEKMVGRNGETLHLREARKIFEVSQKLPARPLAEICLIEGKVLGTEEVKF
jgi:hypothetical protein